MDHGNGSWYFGEDSVKTIVKNEAFGYNRYVDFTAWLLSLLKADKSSVY